MIYKKLAGSKILELDGFKENSTKITIVTSLGRIELSENFECGCGYETEVAVAQIDGSIDRHIGATFREIREKKKVKHEEDCSNYSCTSTFYDLVTSKGILSFRWTGASNGAYSEEVEVKEVIKKHIKNMDEALFLECLKNAGVENWSKYSIALREYDKKTRIIKSRKKVEDLLLELSLLYTVDNNDDGYILKFNGDIDYVYGKMKDIFLSVE